MAKKDNIFKRAKAYRAEHPRVSFQDAIQRVKGKISAPKKVSGTTTKPKTIRTRKAAKPVHVSSSRTVSSYKTDWIKKAQAILTKIDKMEAKRTKHKSKEMKDIYAIAINAEHHKLKQLQQKFK